ncbi:6016_t:CDS:2, partial [Funneliformis geosporum]
KIAIAAGYLRDAAAKWYDKNQGNYQGWHVQGNPNIGHSPQTLNAAITKAKEIKIGFTIAQPI